jgi:hypothetical protein
MINQCFRKRLRGAGVAGLLLWAGYGFTFPAAVAAGPAYATARQQSSAVETVDGSFDGLDLKKRWIWISDVRYVYDGSTKIKGTSTKLGLITDLKQGERVKAEIKPNEDGHEPYVVIIYRQ